MKKAIPFLFFFSVILISYLQSFAQPIPKDSLYFGQTPPGSTPVIFAPGIVSLPNRNEPCITFSPDGKLVFFYIEFWPNPGTPYVLFSEYKPGGWTTPAQPDFAKGRLTGEPFFAPSGNRIYLNATKAVSQIGSVDLSYVEKKDTSWSNPISLGNPPNLAEDQYHSCIVADTSIYFSSSSGYICRSQYKNGKYQQRVILPFPVNYANTSQTWGDPFVAPDESYIIFKSIRSGGLGGNDIYISYRKADKTWTNPKNLGDKINTIYDETSGDVTPDGKYMTFGRSGDLYWVSTGFIDSLKHTNFIPYVKNQIPAQSAQVGKLFSYTISDTSFIDDDGNNTLSFSAALSNGNPLPSWLVFNKSTRTFSGTPTESANISIKVTATDNAGASASAAFSINVTLTGVNSKDEQNPNSINLYQNYPNPFNPSTTIGFSLPKRDYVTLKVYDILGREVKVLINNELKSGENSVPFNSANLTSGIYFYCLKTGGFTQNKQMIILK